MKDSSKTAIQGGLFLGLANMVWLYVAYFLGLHTSGIVVFQFFMLIWFWITLAGFVLTLRLAKRRDSQLSYLRGLGLGAIAAAVSALVAVVAQVGYFKIVHPAWPDVMAQEAREYFESQGLTEAEIEQEVERARDHFTLTNYAIQSAIAALVLGVFLSSIILIFLRAGKRFKVSAEPT